MDPMEKALEKAEENETFGMNHKAATDVPANRRGNPRWAKGQSGNPHGRPAVPSLKNALQKRFKQLLAEHEQKLIEALPEIRPALIAEAAKGSIAHISEVHKVVGAHKKSEGNNVTAIQINFKDDKAEFE